MQQPTPADPIKQQLARAREKQILDAAATVFAAKGFHQATIRDIAQQAGIADGTIYNYFDDKPALLLGIFERMRAAIMAEGMPPGPGEGNVRTFLEGFLRQPLAALAEDEFALFRIILSEMVVDAELRTRYYDQIMRPTLALAERFLAQEAVAQSLDLTPADARLLVRVLASTVLGLMVAHGLGDEVVQARWQELPAFLAELMAERLERERR